MCSRNLMGGAGEKIDVVAGAMLRSHRLHLQEKLGCLEKSRVRQQAEDHI